MRGLSLILYLSAVSIALAFPDLRVIGGNNAEKGEYPFMVSIKRHQGFSHFCGGAIISDRWVLTAAHCVYDYKPEEIYVLAGTHYLTGPGEMNEVSSIVLHEKFHYPRTANDIALLKVETAFDFSNKHVRPASIGLEIVGGGVEVTAIGWGVSNMSYPSLTYDLQQLEMSTLTYEDCKSKVNKTTTDEICVYNNQNTGVCSGDSGSPLVLKGTNEVVGVASWVMWCASGYPDMYTRVTSYLDWINEKLDDSSLAML